MYSDDEVDPHLTPLQYNRSQTSLQNLFFPRGKTQVFTPLTSASALRRNSSFRSTPVRPGRHRSQVLLDRSGTPAHNWEKFRKTEEELKGIKKKKVREFYENQVFTSLYFELGVDCV